MKKASVSKVRVLPLQAWMTCMGSGRYTPPLAECSPAYNKDGYYYDDRSKLCWFEYNGKGWIYDVKAFQYDYEISNAPEIKSPILNDYDKIIALTRHPLLITSHPLLKAVVDVFIKRYIKAQR